MANIENVLTSCHANTTNGHTCIHWYGGGVGESIGQCCLGKSGSIALLSCNSQVSIHSHSIGACSASVNSASASQTANEQVVKLVFSVFTVKLKLNGNEYAKGTHKIKNITKIQRVCSSI